MQHADMDTDQSVQSRLQSSMAMANCGDNSHMAEVVQTGSDVILPAEQEMKQEDPEETVKEEGEEESDERIPTDRGWAWMVTLGVFVNYVLQSGYLKSSGLFFVELLDKFQAPASQTALLFSVRYGVTCICGFYVMNVCLDRFGARKLNLIGGSMMALSAILSSFANQLTLLICLQSGLLAVGVSMLIYPGQVLLGHYFRRRRYLALCITECGVSIGNIIVPPLVSYLLEHYALQGALLIYGGLCLNCLSAALLLRPRSYYTKRHSRYNRRQGVPGNVEDTDEDPLDVSGADEEAGLTFNSEWRTSLGYTFLNSSSALDLADKGRKVTQSGASDNHSEDQSKGVESTSFRGKKTGTKWEECEDTSVELDDKSAHPKLTSSPPIQHKCRGFLKYILSCPRAFVLPLDISLFRDPIFCLFMGYVTFSNFVAIPVEYLPALVSQHGVTESQAALLLSIIGGLDLVCRVICGLIAHSNRVRISTLAMLSYLILGLIVQFVALMKSFEHFVVLAVILGLLGSVANCLFSVLVIEIMGLDNMAKGLGWSVLLSGAFMTAVHPLLGYIRDTTGSYVMVYHVIGGGMIVSALLLCCEGPVRRFQARRQKLIE